MTKLTLPGGSLVYRDGSGDTVEIADIAVDNDKRRTGIGKLLLRALFVQVGDCQTVFAITRADNLIAQQFYEACGFEVTGVLRRFYKRDSDTVDAVMYGRSPQGPL